MKLQWGGEALETALNDYDPDDTQYNDYAGDRPPKGAYQFKLVRLEATKSTNGFPQMIAHFELAPHKPEHKQYKGYYMRDYIIVKDDGSTAFRTRPFLDALGVTAKQFRTMTNATSTDRETNNGDAIAEIDKIGPVKVPGNLLMCYIKPGKRNPDYEDIKYLGKGGEGREAEDADDSDAGDDGADDNKAPF